MATRLPHRRTLADSLRHFRKQAGLTQEQLGEKANLSSKFIGEIERRNKTISLDALARIANALKIRLKDLLRDP